MRQLIVRDHPKKHNQRDNVIIMASQITQQLNYLLNSSG